MTKEQAREYLKEYLEKKDCNLPIVDEVVIQLQTPFIISEVTFKYLICIAYDLRPIEKNEL